MLKDDKLLRISDVMYIVGFSKPSIYRLIKDREFPKPLKIGRSSRWKRSEVLEWIDTQSRGDVNQWI